MKIIMPSSETRPTLVRWKPNLDDTVFPVQYQLWHGGEWVPTTLSFVKELSAQSIPVIMNPSRATLTALGVRGA